MPFVAGVYTAPVSAGAFNTAVTGSPATPAAWNALLTDISTALSTAILKDGTQTVTANIPFAGFKLTGVGPGTAATDGANLSQTQSSAVQYAATVGGTANAITATLSPVIVSRTAGLVVRFIATASNTSASVTLNVNGTGVSGVTWPSGVGLAVNDILINAMIEVAWNTSTGTWQLMSVTNPPAFWQNTTQVTSTSATGTTLIPWDDTIPQITEGVEYMSFSITPRATGNRGIVRVVFNYAYSISDQVTVALFQDATTDALAAVSNWASAGGNPQQAVLTCRLSTLGSINVTTTFRVRAGGNSAGTLTFNGAAGARKLGGVNASSISIDEVSP